MLYPRLFRRHIAITTLCLLLTLVVLGLIVILCIFHDSEHNFPFKSCSNNEKQVPNSASLKYESKEHKSIILTTAKNAIKNNLNEDKEQQHIYIDEFYTENTIPKKVYDNHINYRKMKIVAETKNCRITRVIFYIYIASEN